MSVRAVSYCGLLPLVCDAEFIQEHRLFKHIQTGSGGRADEQSLSLFCAFSMKWAEMAVQSPVMHITLSKGHSPSTTLCRQLKTTQGRFISQGANGKPRMLPGIGDETNTERISLTRTLCFVFKKFLSCCVA